MSGSSYIAPTPSPGDPIKAGDAAAVLRTVRGLAEGRPTDTRSVPLNSRHPFKLFVKEGKAYCWEGQVDRLLFVADSGGNVIESLTPLTRPTWDSSGLSLSRLGLQSSSIGSHTLSTSTDYGFWLKYPAGFANALSQSNNTGLLADAAVGEEIETYYYSFDTADATLVVSTTHTDAGDQGGMTATTSGFGYLYVGKIAVDANGGATITQVLRGDRTLPSWLFVTSVNTVSSDSTNLISQNPADGGAFLEAQDITDAGFD